MPRNWRQLLRPLVPNFELRIRHVEQSKRLTVRCREHLGLIARGARAYEPEYVDALRTLITPGATVFDVGANIGFYTVLFSTWVGPLGKVVAYEPDPENVELLRRNLKLNRCSNVILRSVALTNACGTERFSVDRVTRMTGHLGNGATYGATAVGKRNQEFIEVSTTTLDVEVKQFGAPGVIKMDIEGGEYKTLLGAANLLQTRRPVIMSEMNSWVEERGGAPRNPEAARYLIDHEYGLWNPDSGCKVQPDCIPSMIIALPRKLGCASGQP